MEDQAEQLQMLPNGPEAHAETWRGDGPHQHKIGLGSRTFITSKVLKPLTV